MKIIYNSLIYIALLILCSCADDKHSRQNLIAGTSADNPPYSFIQNDKIVGFEIDLINKVAEEIDVQIDIRHIPFDGVIQSLTNGDVDLLIAGMSQTPERNEMVDFSVPYWHSSFTVITRNDLKITTLSDLKNKVIGAQIGSTWQIEAQNIANNVEGVKVRVLANNFLLLKELSSSNIDAIILESPQASEFITQYNNLNRFDLSDTKSSLSMVFLKNSGLRQKINDVILKLQNDGYIDGLAKKWFINITN